VFLFSLIKIWYNWCRVASNYRINSKIKEGKHPNNNLVTRYNWCRVASNYRINSKIKEGKHPNNNLVTNTVIQT
jgi:hypothetical protein